MISLSETPGTAFAEKVREIFSETGLLAQAKNFEYRPEQQEMAVAVAQALSGERHLVVEAAINAAGGRFVANDCDLSIDRRLWLVTGPNMAGKSTFLRQNAVMAAAWCDVVPITELVLDDHHHYTAVAALGDPSSVLFQAVAAQMGLAL